MTTPSTSSPKAQSAIELSVLITCYYEENSIDEFYRRLSVTLESLNRSYEIIFVNDGSRDGTWEKLKAIFAKDPHVRAVLDLFKNSGQQAAATAALSESRGRALVYIDSDLQLAPEDLPVLVARVRSWLRPGYWLSQEPQGRLVSYRSFFPGQYHHAPRRRTAKCGTSAVLSRSSMQCRCGPFSSDRGI